MIASLNLSIIDELAERVASDYGHPELAQKLARVASERIPDMLLQHVQDEMEFLMNFILDEVNAG